MSNLTWDYAAPPTLERDFPQLAWFSDTLAVAARLARSTGSPIQSCAIETVRYIAGRTLEIVYRVAADDMVSMRCFQPGTSRTAYQAALDQAERPGLVFHLPEWDSVAWWLPADPGNLPIPELRRRTAQYAGTYPQTMRVLSYLPGERYALHCVGGDVGVVGKLRAGSGAQASHQAAMQLWQIPGRRFHMPEPLLADEQAGMRWERFVPGVRLEHVLMTQAPEPLLGAVMSSLADLHRTPVAGLPAYEPASLLRRASKVVRRLRIALPEQAAQAQALVATLQATAPLHTGPQATLHGDLHTANILLGASGPVLIDLDSLISGPPAFDLAMLATRLMLSAANRGQPLAEAWALTDALPTLYAAAGGVVCWPDEYAWYVAALLLARQVKTCLRNAAPQAATIASLLLNQADAILSQPQ